MQHHWNHTSCLWYKGKYAVPLEPYFLSLVQRYVCSTTGTILLVFGTKVGLQYHWNSILLVFGTKVGMQHHWYLTPCLWYKGRYAVPLEPHTSCVWYKGRYAAPLEPYSLSLVQ